MGTSFSLRGSSAHLRVSLELLLLPHRGEVVRLELRDLVVHGLQLRLRLLQARLHDRELALRLPRELPLRLHLLRDLTSTESGINARI